MAMTSKNSYRFLYIFLILMLFTATAHADTEFTIEQFTTADGLANNTVRYIMQDSKGRFWFATSNGVSRYENGKFVNYHPSRDKSVIGLRDQRTKGLHEHDGKLWINTSTGYSCFNLHTEAFIDFEKKGIKVPVFPRENTKEIKDKQGRVWRITENDGLYIIYNNGKTEHFTTSSKNNALPTNALKCIYQDIDGGIWIGTDNLGVSKITVMQNSGIEYLLEGENVRMVTKLNNGDIAVGSRAGDLFIYNNNMTQQASQTHYSYNTYCMYEDGEHNIWRGTKGGGLMINDDSIAGLPHNEIYSILGTNGDYAWVGTFGGGLAVYDIHTNSVKGTFLNHSYGSKRIRKIIEDKDKQIWIATSDGVYVCNSKTILNGINKEKEFKHLCVENGKLYSNEIRTIFKDSKGRIYIAEAGEGFAVYDNGNISHFTQDDSLVNNMVQCFVEDKQGFIWISTEFGISRFNPAKNKFTNYFFSKNMLNNVYSENCGTLLSDGRIVFGTNNGLIVIQPSIYNASEKTTDIDIEDITINGQPMKRGIIYVVSQWWKSPWAIVVLIVIAGIIITIVINVRRNNSRFHKAIKALTTKKTELAAEKDVLEAEKGMLVAEKDELTAQKEELSEEKEKLTRDVKIRRKAEQSAEDIEFINQVEQIADEQIANPDFSADDFADKMGFGRTIFFRKMKELTGYSPKEFIKQKRIHRAAFLISTTSRTIAEISYMVGINDPLYFSRIFKAEYNCTPTEWRKKVVEE